MEYYSDEKWKLSREDRSSRSYSTNKPSFLMKSFSHRSSSKSNLLRSLSKKNSFDLSRSSSQRSGSSKSSLSRSSSQKCAEFTRKCSSLAKEHKARFYIVKRCITMLVCWKKNSDEK